MRLIVLLFLFFNINSISMGQQISLRPKGLSIIEVGNNLLESNGLKFDKIERNQNIQPTYSGAFEDDFKYYFIDSDTMFIEGGGLIKDIFFAIDKNDTVRSIFIVFESISDDIALHIDRVYDKALSQSHSSIGNRDTNYKIFWKKNEISVLLTKYVNRDLSKIVIYDTKYDEKSPWIDVLTMYK